MYSIVDEMDEIVQDDRVSLAITDHVLQARCVEACIRVEGDAGKTIRYDVKLNCYELL